MKFINQEQGLLITAVQILIFQIVSSGMLRDTLAWSCCCQLFLHVFENQVIFLKRINEHIYSVIIMSKARLGCGVTNLHFSDDFIMFGYLCIWIIRTGVFFLIRFFFYLIILLIIFSWITATYFHLFRWFNWRFKGIFFNRCSGNVCWNIRKRNSVRNLSKLFQWGRKSF